MAKKRRCWKDAVRMLIAKTADSKGIFTLNDMKKHQKKLSLWFPENNFIMPKVRQILQQLRDSGEVKFVSNGVYRLLKKEG